MNIYALKRKDTAGKGEAVAFVVVAPTGGEARRLAAMSAGREGAFPWAFEVEPVKVGTAEPNITPGILLGNYIVDYD
jgi:hypothetical protein